MPRQLRIDDTFKAFQEGVEEGKCTSPLQIPIEIWGNPSWELLNKKEFEELFLPFLRFSVLRATRTMPVYKDAYKTKLKIDSFEDFQSIPILVKDSTETGIGFREKVNSNPYILLPNDIKPNYQIYKSGGTRALQHPPS